MRDLGKIYVVGCFWLGAFASSAFGAETTLLPPSPQDRPVGQTEQAPSANPLWGISIKQLSATRDRPIFSASRRPPPPAVVGPVVAVASPPVQKPKEPDRPQLSLLGTIVNGDDGFAILMDQTTKTPMQIKVGAGHQGWTLRLIQSRSVTLQRGEVSVVLAFPEPASGEDAGAGRVAATPPALPPRLGFPGQPAAPNPPPRPNSVRTPVPPFSNRAQR